MVDVHDDGSTFEAYMWSWILMAERSSTIPITSFIGASYMTELGRGLTLNRGLKGSLGTPMPGRGRGEYLVRNCIGVRDSLMWKGSGSVSTRRCTLGVAKPIKLKMLRQELS